MELIPTILDQLSAVPAAAGETLEVFWMGSYHHSVGSHVKLSAERSRNPLTHIHVGDAEPIDVLWPSGKASRRQDE